MSTENPAPLGRRTYTTDEVADAVLLSRKTVLARIHEGRIHAVRIGRRWRVPAAEFDRLTGGAGREPEPEAEQSYRHESFEYEDTGVPDWAIAQVEADAAASDDPMMREWARLRREGAGAVVPGRRTA